MPISLQFEKLSPDMRVKLQAPPANKLSYFKKLLDSGCGSLEERSAVCIAAYDSGFRGFALENRPGRFLQEETETLLAESGKKVSGSDGKAVMFTSLSAIPIRNGGNLYQRGGLLVRIDYSDGKKAYCKTRNAIQECIGIELASLCGLQVYRYESHPGWVVMEGVPGRTLFEHALIPDPTKPDIISLGKGLYSRILAINAFDYIFAMMDRNERGLVFGEEGVPTAIDHEYLFVNCGLPMHAVNFYNFRLFFRELGMDGHLIRDDGAIYRNLVHAGALFSDAISNLDVIAHLLYTYFGSAPVVDSGFFQKTLSERDFESIMERIIQGPIIFADSMQAGTDEIRRSGMFQEI